MMQKVLVGAMTIIVAGMSFGAAVAGDRRYTPPPPPSYGAGYPPPPPAYSHPGLPPVDCLCTRNVSFYGVTPGYGDIRVNAPGVRVYGEPVVIPSGRIDIQGPPVYVEAPPVRVAAPQIYLHRPEVVVRPSAVTVEAPEIHYGACAEGSRCEPAPTRR
ncbi:hypothetical protein [Caulobacter sp. RHG1]|uniref:hypothetical protein n=1 Tax=Caulobacter sp. (strain RHG1) TaxID=2545762 RepID=UPI001557BB73|nr:hypothetical protein [Caulobacter sp. RHG1]NQE63119.1 hypothetical protein [Caulobacter sp. RHG1]